MIRDGNKGGGGLSGLYLEAMGVTFLLRLYTRGFKDVRAKIFQSTEFFKFLLQADNELLVPEMQKKLGVTVFVSEIRRVVKLY